jgi:sugar/nucleoside kinase (ribokinase family)
VVVLGDLMVDVVLAPAQPLVSATDVPGRVSFVQGGSAANTARWLARLGARSSLVCSVGRDAAGRALIDALRGDGVVMRASRVTGARTGRIGVVLAPDGERSFVADRGAADRLAPGDLDAS